MSLSSVIREQERGDICSCVHLLLTFGDFFMFHIQIRLEPLLIVVLEVDLNVGRWRLAWSFHSEKVLNVNAGGSGTLFSLVLCGFPLVSSHSPPTSTLG